MIIKAALGTPSSLVVFPRKLSTIHAVNPIFSSFTKIHGIKKNLVREWGASGAHNPSIHGITVELFHFFGGGGVFDEFLTVLIWRCFALISANVFVKFKYPSLACNMFIHRCRENWKIDWDCKFSSVIVCGMLWITYVIFLLTLG